jgi:hypothetical protein
LIALVLAAYGVYTALYIPAMLVGAPAPLLLIGFLAQAVCALAAAFGLWTNRGWAGVVIVLLGISITATQLFEVLLGIVPYMRAVLISVLAIAGSLALAAYVRRQSS